LEEGNDHFWALRSRKKGFEKANKFYNQLKDILNRTNKNDHILLSADLNGGRRNGQIHKIIGLCQQINNFPVTHHVVLNIS